MSLSDEKLVGLFVGSETDLTDAVILRLNDDYDGIRAELIKVGGTFSDEQVPYHVIIDRMSHEIPYYRSYVKYACVNGTYAINNPFTWSSDTKFVSSALVNKLGMRAPRTMVLPNKDVDFETVADSFRNLKYPMDWQGIIDYIGGPAIFKDVHIGGRRFSHRVSNVDELIQRFDESGTRTMILQQVLETEEHYHCLVIGPGDGLLMAYDRATDTYNEPDGLDAAVAEQMKSAARELSDLYAYDINLPEFAVFEDEIYVINATNPVPQIDRKIMPPGLFKKAIKKITDLAYDRALNPVSQAFPVDIPDNA